ncbi:actin-histidine N-methyltransferase [Leptidea sinapis]|uniref:actin-histidine N-methyltransferase n=1 Tax=Leptidea sinapis TaxID=189913 RepID=UPI002139CEDB|nr:actin-histidine N-methyltransferase [Leptidea sinapis]
MSRKQNSKQKENKFNQIKRRELSILVQKLAKLTSVFYGAEKVTKVWDRHTEIDRILTEIIQLETPYRKQEINSRESSIEKYVSWLEENGAQFEGVAISAFDGYGLGLKALKHFPDESLILTIPEKVMMTEQDAYNSELSGFIKKDLLMQTMSNVSLALFLLLEKSKPDSFWKPYIDNLPEKYSTVLYFTLDELAEIKPSPVFEVSLNLYTNIARQYAYFWREIFDANTPELKSLRDTFTFENYRWAVSTVMTRQNRIQLGDKNTTAFIPLWDMCNHENGKITTDFNKELRRGECFALRDFQPGEQIFIFYGVRSNANLFLHNGFVYPNNKFDTLSLYLGVSSNDPLREGKLSLLKKLGLANITHYQLTNNEVPLSPELLAFIRIFNMNKEDLEKWLDKGVPGDLVSLEASSAEEVGCDINKRSYKYLLTRCQLLLAVYKKTGMQEKTDSPDTINRKNAKLLKQCEVQLLEGAIKYLTQALEQFPQDESK